VLAALALLVAAAPASAGAPLYGTVGRSWASVTRHGRARSTFAASAPQIFASFTWRRVPTPGQPLAIAWYGPKGTLAAIWKDRTLRRDRPGTVLYASVPRTVYATRPGSWQVVLRVAGISRSAVSLRVTR
jgi:hypothetical protein